MFLLSVCALKNVRAAQNKHSVATAGLATTGRAVIATFGRYFGRDVALEAQGELQPSPARREKACVPVKRCKRDQQHGNDSLDHPASPVMALVRWKTTNAAKYANPKR